MNVASYRSWIDAGGAAATRQGHAAGAELIYGSGSYAAKKAAPWAYAGKHRVRKALWHGARRFLSRAVARSVLWPVGVAATAIDYGTNRRDWNPFRKRSVPSWRQTRILAPQRRYGSSLACRGGCGRTY